MNREFSLPIDFNKIKGGSVLDIGCGPGDWCLNLAEEFPDLQQVIGVDIVNDMFPDPSYSVPSNCQFMTLNVLNGLHGSFPLESFDCIHFRFMSLAFTYDQYLTAVQNCWDLLKPGGYIVLMEMDTKVSSPGPTTEKLNQHGMHKLFYHDKTLIHLFIDSDGCSTESWSKSKVGTRAGYLDSQRSREPI